MQRVVDFGYPDKTEDLLAGGVSARHFLPNQNDQARLWAVSQRTAKCFNLVYEKVLVVAQASLVPCQKV